MGTTSGCDPDRLRRLLDGELGEPDRAEALAHLDACEPCRLSMEGLAAGSRWWGDLRRLAEPPQGPTLSMGDRSGDVGPSDTTLDFLEPPASPGHVGRFGPYDVIELIGRGGMGVVLKAFDPALHRVVAIKVLAPELAASASARQRFHREARAAASVIHDHVVTIHAVAESRGLPYLVMAYVKGMSLQERIDRTGPLSTTEVLRIGMQAARGLAAAHAQGLVHRDVKPSNILLENGVERVKLTDFGLARAVDDASLTQSGVVAGTPQYMAPEQARGEPVDHRADLFSLGSVLYAMCTGRSPFRADSTPAVLRRVSEDTPRPIRQVNPEIPEWLERVIARLHAKDPADRFQSAAEVADRLAAHLSDHQGPPLRIETREEVPPAKMNPRRSPGRLRMAAGLLLLLAGLGASEAVGVTHVSRLLGTILRFPTGDGTLVVEVDDPGIQVAVNGKAIAIRGAGVEEIRLHPGAYEVQATRDGRPVLRELVTVERGGKRLVRVGLETGRPSAAPVAVGPPAVPQTGRRATIPGLGSEVHRLAFSPDGKKLAAVFEDGQLVIWHPAGPWEILRLQAHSLPIYGLAFDPSGKKILTGAGNWRRGETAGQVKLWEVEDGGLRATDLKPLTFLHSVNVVAFSPDGRIAAAGGVEIRLWDVATRRELMTLPGQTQALEFSPDGRTLAAGGDEKVVKLWDVASGRLKGQLAAHSQEVEAVAFSPDGRTLASGARDKVLILWDVETLRERVVLPGQSNWVLRLAFSGAGSVLAAGDGEEQVKLWDVATGAALGPLLPGGRPGQQVAFDPRGDLLASGKKDGTISLWDVAAPGPKAGTPGPGPASADRGPTIKAGPSPRVSVPGDGSECTTVAFSPDGSTLAAAYGNGTVALRDAADGRTRKTLEGPPQFVSSVAFSADGKSLALGTGYWTRRETDGVVEVWDVASGTRRYRCEGHKGPVYAVAFAPDGKVVASGGVNGAVRLWDAQTGAPRPPSIKQEDWIFALAFAPDGRTIATGEAMAVRLVDATTGEARGTLEGHRGQVEAVAFSPDGRTIATGGRDRLIKLWDAATLRERATLTGHAGWVTSLAFAPDGSTLAAAGLAGPHTKEVKLWDVASGRALATLPRANSHSVAFAPDGRSIATGELEGAVKIWSVDDLLGSGASTEIRRFEGHRGPVKSAAFSPDGRTILSGSGFPFGDRTMRLWDVETGREVRRFEGPGSDGPNLQVLAVAISPDGRTALSAGEGPAIHLWDVATGVRLRTFRKHTGWVNSVAFSADGRRAISSGPTDSTARAWDLESGRELACFEGHTGGVLAAAFSPDGLLAVTGGRDRTVRLWDAGTGRPHSTLDGHTEAVEAVAFSRDGKLILSGGRDAALRIWDAVTLKELRHCPGRANNLAVSPDGRSVLTGGADRIAQLWDLETARELRRFGGHADDIWSVAISPDGRRALSAGGGSVLRPENRLVVGNDFAIRLWDMDGDARGRGPDEPGRPSDPKR